MSHFKIIRSMYSLSQAELGLFLGISINHVKKGEYRSQKIVQDKQDIITICALHYYRNNDFDAKAQVANEPLSPEFIKEINQSISKLKRNVEKFDKQLAALKKLFSTAQFQLFSINNLRQEPSLQTKVHQASLGLLNEIIDRKLKRSNLEKQIRLENRIRLATMEIELLEEYLPSES